LLRRYKLNNLSNLSTLIALSSLPEQV